MANLRQKILAFDVPENTLHNQLQGVASCSKKPPIARNYQIQKNQHFYHGGYTWSTIFTI